MIKILLSCRIPKEISENIKREGFDPVLLPEFKHIDKPVSAHPDMLVVLLPNNAILTYKSYYEKNKKLFNELGNFVVTESDPGKKYPEDIRLNAIYVKNTLISHKNVSDTLLNSLFIFSENKSVNRITTKQGYARCSTCLVDEDHAITSDPSIAEALAEAEIDVLKINPGDIKLKGYDSGFIGGASFVYEDTVYFFGDINRHRDAESIKKYIEASGKKYVCLSKEELADYGGAVIV